jgi:hypothetical protein
VVGTSHSASENVAGVALVWNVSTNLHSQSFKLVDRVSLQFNTEDLAIPVDDDDFSRACYGGQSLKLCDFVGGPACMRDW